MQAQRDNVHPSSRHPWEGSEPDFQFLLVRQRNGSAWDRDHSIAAERVCELCRRSSVGLLRHLRIPGAEELSKDVSQEWFVQLETGVLRRCDHRPVHPVAYATMRYVALAAARKLRRFTMLPDKFDIVEDERGSLARLIAEEEMNLLGATASALPPKQRRAIERLLQMGRMRTEPPMRVLKQADYGNTYRARLRLRDWLDRHRDMGA